MLKDFATSRQTIPTAGLEVMCQVFCFAVTIVLKSTSEFLAQSRNCVLIYEIFTISRNHSVFFAESATTICLEVLEDTVRNNYSGKTFGLGQIIETK